MNIVDTQIESLAWVPETGLTINNPPCTYIDSVNMPDGLSVVMGAGVPYGGGLVSCSRPVPLVNGKPLEYMKATWAVKPSAAAAKFNRCYELDCKVVFPAAPNPSTTTPNVMDGSFQIVKGQCMIDNAAHTWATIGLSATLPADAWTIIAVSYHFDWLKMESSVLSVAVGEDPLFTLAVSMQNIPAMSTNWASYDWGAVPQPLLKLQIQLVCDAVPAPYEVSYHCEVEWSDSLS